MVAPSGEQLEIGAGGYRAVVTEGGSSLRELTHDGVPLIGAYAEGEMSYGGRGQVLMPWVNRLRDGHYEHDGAQQQLALSEPARHNASHGLVRWVSWSLVERSADAVRLGYRLPAQTGYPWTLDLTASYSCSATGLRVELGAVNLGGSAAPFAAGFHPYLDVGAPVDDATLTMPAGTILRTDDRMLPTGAEPVEGDHDFREGRPIGEVRLDDGFRLDAPGGLVRLESGDRAVELEMDDAWRWLQVFTGDGSRDPRTVVAVEPMTAPADAFNSGTDLVVLEPGQSWVGRFVLRRG